MHCGAAAEILLMRAAGSGPVPSCSLSCIVWQVVDARQSDAEAELLRARTEAMQAQLEQADLKARSDGVYVLLESNSGDRSLLA